MGIRDKFVEDFGEDQAVAIEDAAIGHKNGVHDSPGTDSFKWALCICLGHQCMEKDVYRESHGITVPWEKLDQWIMVHGDLKSHDGDVDYLAAATGVYDKYIGKPEHA